jgi:hypothetical protein
VVDWRGALSNAAGACMEVSDGKRSKDSQSDISIVDEQAVILSDQGSKKARALIDLSDSAAKNWQHKAKHWFSFAIISLISAACLYILIEHTDEKKTVFAMTVLSSIVGGAITYLFHERTNVKGR